MKMPYKITAIFFSAFLLVSCTKEVKVDIPGFEEQLVVDGTIETGNPPFVILSKSKDIYAPTDTDAFLAGFVSGATVTVSDGTTTWQLDEVCTDNLPPGYEEQAAAVFGVPPSEVSNYHLCAYTKLDGSLLGEVGKTYTLTVEVEGKTYSGSTTILPPTPLDSVYWKPENGTNDRGFSYAFLTDPQAPNDAYFWEVKRINTVNGEPIDGFFTPTYSPVFDDEFFNGLSFEFYYENPMSYEDSVPDGYRGYYQLGDTVVIKFSKIDSSVYEYMEKKYTQMATGGSPFSTPTNIPSNMNNGALGVWAGFSPSYDTLICAP